MVYNISKGRNAEIAGRSPVLNGYSELIAEVNRNRETMEPAEAIEAAIKSCVERNILVYFLEKHGSEVLNMLFTEWNQDDALAVRYEEGMEDGREEGVAIGEARGMERGMEKVFSLLEQGVSLAEAKQRLGLG
jgi:flagellar biosynthesis/type III secretory pathway protein FliH